MLKMPDPSEIIFDYLMKSKMGCVAVAVIRPVGIDVTVDKDDLIKMSRDRFHQACGHPTPLPIDVHMPDEICPSTS